MRIASIMTSDPLTIRADADPAAALRLMDEHALRHLPVVQGGELLGVVSDRDLLDVTDGRSNGDASARPVSSLMHERVVSVQPADTLVTASLDLVLRGIGCLPVVDGGALVGIVTETDLLRCYHRAASDGSLTGDFDPPIEDYVSTALKTVEPTATLGQAAERMSASRVRHLPVVAAGALAGLLSDRDLRLARGRGVDEQEPVSSFMTTSILTVRPDALMTHAAWMMLEHKVSCLPVERDGELLGILTCTDVLEHCGHTLWEPE